MSPSKIMLIRHAEKPAPGNPDPGIDANGNLDDQSLSATGWRRANALVEFFVNPNESLIARPDNVFAAKPGGGSERPLETVTPLARRLWPPDGSSPRFDATHDENDLAGLATAVIAAEGVVLISWEHKRIPAIAASLPNAPDTPRQWPGHRFDVVWVFDASNGGWSFNQVPQLLFASDLRTTI